MLEAVPRFPTNTPPHPTSMSNFFNTGEHAHLEEAQKLRLSQPLRHTKLPRVRAGGQLDQGRRSVRRHRRIRAIRFFQRAPAPPPESIGVKLPRPRQRSFPDPLGVEARPQRVYVGFLGEHLKRARFAVFEEDPARQRPLRAGALATIPSVAVAPACMCAASGLHSPVHVHGNGKAPELLPAQHTSAYRRTANHRSPENLAAVPRYPTATPLTPDKYVQLLRYCCNTVQSFGTRQNRHRDSSSAGALPSD